LPLQLRSAFLEALAAQLGNRDVGDGELHKLAIAARQQVAPWQSALAASVG